VGETDPDTRVIFDGQQFVAIWQSCYMSQVGEAGYVCEHKAWPVDGQGVVAPEWPLGVGKSEYAYTFGLARPGKELRAVRVSPAGVVLDPQGIAIASQPGCDYFGWFKPTSAAFDGERTVFAWTGCGAAGGSDIFGATVAPDGAVSTFAITADGAHFNFDPALAGTGQGTALVTYQSFQRDMPYGAYRVFGRLLSEP
jgi:hypothetical protein